MSGTSDSSEVILDGLSLAQTPQQLLERLQVALQGTAPCQVFCSVRGNDFVLRWSKTDPSLSPRELSQEQKNVLQTACQAGYFLGPLPPDGKERKGLEVALGMREREEIYVAPVTVAHRVALLVILGRFEEAFSVTRWVDALVRRAGPVLEQLARSKKS
jgi:hypothetical protein